LRALEDDDKSTCKHIYTSNVSYEFSTFGIETTGCAELLETQELLRNSLGPHRSQVSKFVVNVVDVKNASSCDDVFVYSCLYGNLLAILQTEIDWVFDNGTWKMAKVKMVQEWGNYRAPVGHHDK